MRFTPCARCEQRYSIRGGRWNLNRAWAARAIQPVRPAWILRRAPLLPLRNHWVDLVRALMCKHLLGSSTGGRVPRTQEVQQWTAQTISRPGSINL
eukprot:1133621-Pelagomonas_calceolata.AAC.5